MGSLPWKKLELGFVLIYAAFFYASFIQRSLHLSHDYAGRLYGLRKGWLAGRFNDISDAQWRSFRENLPILTIVMGSFVTIANFLRYQYGMKGRGMSLLWTILSLCYLVYLHGACVAFIFAIASANYFISKTFVESRYYLGILWSFNVAFLVLNRVYEGYPFSLFGQSLAFLDNYRGTFRWHICFNFVVLRMISFGWDYYAAFNRRPFDLKKHMQRCEVCSSGKTCYHALQEKGLHIEKYSFCMYMCYLIYAPLYISGPIVSFNAFAAQLEMPQKSYSFLRICFYGLRWFIAFLLMELITHFFYYNAFAKSGLWSQLSPFQIFIVAYGVINFMWLKFFLIWRYFRFWSLVSGVETPENMPRCISNCHDLETFWKSWHASYNKWLVRYMYIPLGGAKRKLLNIWVIFTFVAIWHDLEWKLVAWAWLTCVFLIPEIVVKSFAKAFKARSSLGEFLIHELSAMTGAVTISCLMIANLVGYVAGPTGIKLLISRMTEKEARLVLATIFFSFYVGVKLMFHIRDMKQKV
ncbi:MBOAT (membrane bound O-acyl transferase) family protein [Carex rostrata]